VTQKGTTISQQPLMLKLGISSLPAHCDGLRRRIACLKSESEIEGTITISEKLTRALFGITTAGESKIEEK
jgi:hypothetical protein